MRLEPKPAPSLAATLAYPLAAIAATLAVASLLVLASGASPFSVFYLVAKGAAGSQFALLETLTRATPLIFTGLAVAVAFRAKLWNIGAEAQLYIGAVVTVVLGTGSLPLPPGLLIPIIMLAAMAAGAFCFRPSGSEDAFRRRRGGHDAAPQLHRAPVRVDAARRPAEGPDGARLAAIARKSSPTRNCRASSRASDCISASCMALVAALRSGW